MTDPLFIWRKATWRELILPALFVVACVTDFVLSRPSLVLRCDPITLALMVFTSVTLPLYERMLGFGRKKQPPNIDRGKVDDIRLMAPGYGEFIPKFWGTVRVAPIVVWESPAVDHPVTTPGHSGGKGLLGGPSPATATTVDHVYVKSFATVFHDGEIFGGVRRIWFDNDLVASFVTSDAMGAALNATISSKKYEAEFGRLSGKAVIAAQAECSGAKKVTGLSTSPGAPNTNLVSYWKLEDLTDSFGTNNLTNNNAATFVAGKVGNAVNLVAASSQYLSKVDNATLDLTTAMSIDGWVKLTSVGAIQTFASKWNYSTDGAWAIQISNTNEIVVNIAPTPTDVGNTHGDTSGLGLTTGTWYHVAVVFDGTLTGNANRLKVFVNGVQKTLSFTGTIPAALLNSAAAFELGRFQGLGRFLDGLLDEVGLWGRALTSAEIITRYNSGTGRSLGGDCIISVNAPSTQAYEMAVHYTSSSALSFDVSIDGATSTSLSCPSSGGSGIVAMVTMNLGSLTAGDHTITFSSSTGTAPALDCIDIVASRDTNATDSRRFAAALDVAKIPAPNQDHAWAFNNFQPDPGDDPVYGDPTGPSQTFNLGKYGQPSIRIYRGTTTQVADSAIIAQEGVGSASAMRGFGYLMVENLTLPGGRVPNVTLEVDQGVHSVAAIVADIYNLVGVPLTQLSLAALAGLALGDSDIDPGTYSTANWQNKTNTTSAAGGAISKTGGADNAYNAGASHNGTLAAATNGAIRFTASQGSFAIGFSTSASPTLSSDILFGVQCHHSDNASQHRLTIQMDMSNLSIGTTSTGSNTPDIGIWAPGDVFQIEIRNGKFIAYQNGLELGGFTPPVASFPLYPAFIAYSSGAGVSAASVSLAGAIGESPASDAGGLLLSSRRSAADLLAEMQTRFQFDLVEVDGVVKAIPRNGSVSDITIPYTDMRAVIAQPGSLPEIPAFDCEIRDIDPYLLPERVDVNYLDPGQDYHNNVQSEMYIGDTTRQDQQSVSLSIVDQSDNMKALAITLMHKAEMEGRALTWQTSYKYLHVHPASIATLTLPNATHVVRVMQAKYSLPAGVIEFQGVRQAPSIYSPTASGSNSSGFESPIAPIPANTKLVIIDGPLLRAEDAGDGTLPVVYIAMCGRGAGAWNGSFWEAERPRGSGNYEVYSTASQASQIGVTSGTLATVTDPSVWDRTNTLVIDWYTPTTLSSVTEAELLANPELNLIAVCNPSDNSVEYIQFATASAGSPTAPYLSRYTISTFLRGRVGTDANVGAHSSADDVVWIDSTVKPRRIELSDVGA